MPLSCAPCRNRKYAPAIHHGPELDRDQADGGDKIKVQSFTALRELRQERRFHVLQLRTA